MDSILVQLEARQSDLSGFLPLLATHILNLLRTDPNSIVNMLYQIDVSESKAKEAFLLINDTQIAHKLAELIIERQLQKIELRKKYSVILPIPEN